MRVRIWERLCLRVCVCVRVCACECACVLDMQHTLLQTVRTCALVVLQPLSRRLQVKEMDDELERDVRTNHALGQVLSISLRTHTRIHARVPARAHT